MDNWAYLVNESQDIFFENFINFCKLSDITEPENSAFLFSFKHGVHIAFLDNVSTNDLGACTSEDNTQQGTDLNDRVTHDSSLI